jgi:hypothetical protein
MPFIASPNNRGRAVGFIRSFSNQALSTLAGRRNSKTSDEIAAEMAYQEQQDEWAKAKEISPQVAKKLPKAGPGVATQTAWHAGYVVIGLALCFLVAMVMLSGSPQFPPPPPGTRDVTSPLGWLGLVCALLLFGSIGIMVKIPSVMNASIDPMVFQIYQSTGIVFVSLVVLV